MRRCILGFLKDLLDSYNEAEKQKLVDLNEENSTRILPIYHNSMSSDGKNYCRSEVKSRFQKS
jgi:hypothetical protein